MAKNSRRPYVTVATGLCLLGALGPASPAAGQTWNQISAKVGVPMRDSSRSHLWNPRGDVNGQVGYPLEINGPSFDCTSGWTADMGVDSGTLPPGMTLDGHGNIAGTPTERGHWTVVMKLANIMCDGHHFARNGMPEESINYAIQQGLQPGDWATCAEGSDRFCGLTTIRFHITGTGEVH